MNTKQFGQVMLPVAKRVGLHQGLFKSNNNNPEILMYTDTEIEYGAIGKTNFNWRPQHLYIFTDDDTVVSNRLKEGDYYYDKLYSKVYICNDVLAYNVNLSTMKEMDIAKVVASTDASLKLPSIPVDYIKKMVDENNIANSVNCKSVTVIDSTSEMVELNNNEIVIVDDDTDSSLKSDKIITIEDGLAQFMLGFTSPDFKPYLALIRETWLNGARWHKENCCNS